MIYLVSPSLSLLQKQQLTTTIFNIKLQTMHNHKMPFISLQGLWIFISLVFFTQLSFGSNIFLNYKYNNYTAFDQDTLIQPFRPKKNWGNNTVYKFVEQSPRFPGCEDLDANVRTKEDCSKSKMIEYVYKELKYPAECKSSNLSGTVLVSFVVDTSGYLENLTVEKSISPCLDAEAMRVVNSMNYLSERWTPGTQNGEKIRFYYRLPISMRWSF